MDKHTSQAFPAESLVSTPPSSYSIRHIFILDMPVSLGSGPAALQDLM